MGVFFIGVEGLLNVIFCVYVIGNGFCLLWIVFKRGGGGLEKDDCFEFEVLGKEIRN